MNLSLRPYQRECVDKLAQAGKGSHLVVMATATGKTFTMATAIREIFPTEPVLWIVHRREIVDRTKKDIPANVHCETVQTVSRRLRDYLEYNILVIDEAHHAAAKTYQKVIKRLAPEYLYGLTATPNRSDGLGLSDTFEDIVYEYNLIRGVEEGHLVRPMIRQIKTGVSLDQVRKQLGDYSTSDLERAINVDSRNQLVVKAVSEAPKPCLVFAVDVEHGKRLSSLLNAPMVHGKTSKEDRANVFENLNNGSLPIAVNCMIYTEGVDIPRLASVVCARPTQSSALYIQIAGRVLRAFEGKTEGWIIDLVDNVSKHPPCQAPTLIGLDPPPPQTGCRTLLNGDLLNDIPQALERAYASFEAIIRNDIIIKDWAKRMKVDTRKIAFVRRPNGELVLHLPRGYKWRVPAPSLITKPHHIQSKIDEIYKDLCINHKDTQVLWHQGRKKRSMSSNPATSKQLNYIRRLNPSYIRKGMTRYDAGLVISALKRVR